MIICSPSVMATLGIFVFLGGAYACSSNRKAINLTQIGIALLLQILCGLAMLKTTLGAQFFGSFARLFATLYSFADAGTGFLFGNLANASGPWGMIFAVKVIPIMIFFGALMSLLSHVGVITLFVRGCSLFLRPLFKASGAETLSLVASSVLGQTEAPLLIKQYLPRMTRSELLTIMVSGMAHLSGAILAVYGSIGVPLDHLLASSIMAVPGSLAIAKLLMPEEEKPETMQGEATVASDENHTFFGALAAGTSDGLNLAVNVAAMLVAFISLIALVNALFIGISGYSLNDIFSYLFYGVALLIGIPVAECSPVATLIGTKLIVNEFVAYSSMVTLELTARTKIIATYALAGFSNLSCIGIQIGGIGAICPSKRSMLGQLGLRALLGGTLVNLINAALVSLFLS